HAQVAVDHVAPRRPAVRRAVDAAVAAGVDRLVVVGVERERVVVGVVATADVGEGPGVGRRVADALPERDAAQVDDVGRGRVDGDVQVVEALAPDVAAGQADRGPGGAAVGG